MTRSREQWPQSAAALHACVCELLAHTHHHYYVSIVKDRTESERVQCRKKWLVLLWNTHITASSFALGERENYWPYTAARRRQRRRECLFVRVSAFRCTNIAAYIYTHTQKYMSKNAPETKHYSLSYCVKTKWKENNFLIWSSRGARWQISSGKKIFCE